MKYISIILFTGSVLSIATAADEATTIVDDTAKINYSVGYQIGSDFQRQDIQIRSDVIIQGIRDALVGDESLMTATEMRATRAALGVKIAEQKRQNKQALLRQRLEQSQRFHADTATTTGVTARTLG